VGLSDDRHDLNAMHETEKTLDDETWELYLVFPRKNAVLAFASRVCDWSEVNHHCAPMQELFSLPLSFGLACALVTCAQAANVAVSTTLDEVNGNTSSIANLNASHGGAGISLREAIIAANNTPGADVITLPAGTYTLTRVGNDSTCLNGDLDVNGSLTIPSAGPATTIVQGATDASFAGSIGDKVFGINQDGTFTNLTVLIAGMTIRYGRNTVPYGDPTFAYTGAGIDVFLTGTGNAITISNCVITGNQNANSYGGGINIHSGN
jgi:hypothetical protein